MSSICENPCPWTDFLLETIDKFKGDVINLLSTTFGLTYNSTNSSVDDEYLRKVTTVFYYLLDWLSFDDFQLQLLRIFLLTFISIIALIYIAWHIYGPRISEQFMEPNSVTEYCDIKKDK